MPTALVRNMTEGGWRQRVDGSERPGRHRWIVERTLAWQARLRRPAVRHGRRADLQLAFTVLGCILICRKQIQRFRS